MLLVFAQHCHIMTKELLAFHMPLFFFISGYLFRYQEEHGNDFRSMALAGYVKKRFYRILLPYLCFECISFILAFVLHYMFAFLNLGDIYMDLDIVAAVKSVLLCIPSADYVGACPNLWFFPCIFVVDILFVVIKRYASCRWALRISVFGGVILSLSTQYIGVRLPFCIDIAFMGYVFVMLGYYGKHLLDAKLLPATSLRLLVYLMIGMPLFFFCVYRNDALFLMFVNKYGNYLYALPGAVLGIFIFVALVVICVRTRCFPKRLFMFFSTNSLVLFPVHLMALSFVSKVVEFASVGACIGDGLAMSFLKLFCIIAIALVITPVINRYFPALAGKYVPKSLRK